jgi:hypothetical protein
MEYTSGQSGILILVASWPSTPKINWDVHGSILSTKMVVFGD